MKKLKFITHHTRAHNYKLVLMVLASFIYCTVILANPLVMQYTIDFILGKQTIAQPTWIAVLEQVFEIDSAQGSLGIMAAIIVLLSVVSSLALYLRSWSMGSYSEVFAERVRNHCYSHIQTLPYAYHVQAKTGDLIQRCTSDIDQITRFLNNQIRELVYALMMVSVAMLVLFSIHPKMAWITMISFPLIFFFAFKFFKVMQKTFKESDEAEADLSNTFQESMDAVRVVKAFNREAFECEKFQKKNTIYRDKTKKMMRYLGIYWGVSDFICFSQILIVLIASIFEVRNGSLTMGQAVVFISYVNLVLWPVRNVGRILSDMGKVSVSIDRINEILDVEPEDLETGISVPLKGDLEFDRVYFKYDDSERMILEDVSFRIERGETVAIMGPTGSGKSSLVHLITRIYDVTSGTIRIDGLDICTLSKSSLRQQVGIVLQEPYLFSKSIRENIRIAAPHSSHHDVEEAARVAAIHDVIESFDQGYDTFVGEKGVTLSGGQKQRVAIARTLIAGQPILIFDDSLSALDSKTDAMIREALQDKEQSVTSLIITHRINSAQNADKIIVMDAGRVHQIGNHQRLIQEPGIYRNTYEIQSNMKGGSVNG